MKANALREIRTVSLILSAIVSLLVFLLLVLFSATDIKTHLLAAIITFLFMMLNSYAVYYVFKLVSQSFPRSSLLRRKILSYSFSYICGLIIFFSIFIGTTPITDFDVYLIFNLKLISTFIIESLVFTTLIILFQNFVVVQIDRNRIILENAKLKTKSAEAVNLVLKQQMHPHFLFNSLHTIKVLYNDNRELAEEYLVHLADFLRTTISETHTVDATVEDEIKMLDTYVKMQQIRFGKGLVLEIKNDSVNLSKSVIPAFSLQPLAENAIKHNHFSDKNPLLISIIINDELLTVSNNINKKKYSENSMGTGLINISERYFIWCGENLEIYDDGNVFNVNFKPRHL